MDSISNKGISTICDWLQRLIILYSCGDNELPPHVKLTINRSRRNNSLSNGILKYLINQNKNIDSVESIYSFYIESDSSENNITANFIIVNNKEKYDVLKVSNFSLYGKECYIILDKQIVDNNNISETVVGLYFILSSLFKTLKHENIVPNTAIYNIPILASIKCIIDIGTDKLYDLITNNIYYANQPPISKQILRLCENYIDETIDFQSCYLQLSVLELIDDIELGDMYIWEYFISKYNLILDDELI